MTMRPKPRRLAVMAAVVLALATPLLARAQSASAAEAMTVNLASVTGTATGVGEGFLYGVSQDGTQPPDQFIQPLGITGMRAGGHATPTGGWIADGYTYGTAMTLTFQPRLASPCARRITCCSAPAMRSSVGMRYAI